MIRGLELGGRSPKGAISNRQVIADPDGERIDQIVDCRLYLCAGEAVAVGPGTLAGPAQDFGRGVCCRWIE